MFINFSVTPFCLWITCCIM